MKVLRLAQREEEYARLADVNVSDEIEAEVERVLKAYVRYLIERELKSAEFLELVSS